MWKTKNSLKHEISKYFLLFSILIIGTLWLFQFLFFNSFYKEQKLNDIKSIVSKLKNSSKKENFEETMNQIALEKSICIEIDDANFDQLYVSSYFGKGCITNVQKTYQYKFDFLKNNKKEATYELINPTYQNHIIVHAVKLSNHEHAFINTSIDPVDGTVSLLRKELIIITILVLVLSYLLANFISSHLSKPIKEINEEAKKIAKGNFNIELKENSSIQEIEELSNTLNYAKKELSKTDELRRDLMANVSHDLKTPLTMIKATAEIAKDLHQNNKEKQEEDMNTIISETDRLTILVNDILDLSKMESTEEHLQLEEFDVIELIQEILKRYDVLIEKEKYHFELITNQDKVVIKADKKKIEQVIYNLLNNAINYTGEDNKVIIKVTKNKTTKVEITDTGKGIKKEEIPYIWDKYYKNEKHHKRSRIGTGLGLSIVKKILEQHHYQYGVISTSKGTTFYFETNKKAS